MTMTTPDLIASIRSLWPRLSAGEQAALTDAIAALRRASAAQFYTDPDTAFFAERLAPGPVRQPQPDHSFIDV